ncbi:MAG: adenylate/guanylate cyclase domain-containing protein [Magnetococcales bacterium]|nr:adenylate/guanylate cyclase domain-containing protein [Magnetococcales bacterium]
MHDPINPATTLYNDALQAVRTAQKFRLEFPELLERWIPEWNLYVADKIDIGLGCGIHTGDVIVGNVGTRFRDQFTALGPPVNLASRIESRAQPGQILLSQSTALRIRDAIRIHPAGEIVDIKNIPGRFDLFEVV